MILEAIFFDNNQGSIDNVKQFCKRIELVKIDETTVDAELLPFDDPDVAAYLASIAPNSYSDILQIVYSKDAYDKRSGIQARHLPIFEQWLLRTAKEKVRAAIFDFDRTLTMFEGLYNVPSFSKLQETYLDRLIQVRDSHLLYRRDYQTKINQFMAFPEPTLHDMVVYLVGGEKRLRMLRGIFQTCVSNNVLIAILTNNGACPGVLFDEILQELFQGIPYSKICSNSVVGKSQFLAKHPQFQYVCDEDLYSGGARKKGRTRRMKPNARGKK